MERQEIYRRIQEAKNALAPTDPQAAKVADKVTKDAHNQYLKVAERIFGTQMGDEGKRQMILPQDSKYIIAKVKSANTKSTLRKYARSIRYFAIHQLNILLKQVDKAQRAGNWNVVEKIVSLPHFIAFTDLSKMLPADYGQNWKPVRSRKGKKSSLLRLPDNWRELMVANAKGQYKTAMMVAMVTGCRPAELEKGVLLKIEGDSLYAQIRGAKVTEYAGQPTRSFRLADHPITSALMDQIKQGGLNEMLVRVEKGNSVTTFMRSIGKKLWPRRKESITVYTARHAMAADCKAAIAEGADPDLVSQVLGHIVDKTATYYGNRFQSGGINVVPSNISVPREVRHKSSERSKDRMLAGKLPSKQKKPKRKLKP